MAHFSVPRVSDEHDVQMEEINKTSKVDTRKLFNAIVGRIACTVISAILNRIKFRASIALDRWIARWYAREAFEATARLDLPTFGLRGAQSRLGTIRGGHSVLWSSLHRTIEIFSTMLQFGTQTMALANTLRGYEGERLLTWATLAMEAITVYRTMRRHRHESGRICCDVCGERVSDSVSAWAVSTKNMDYVKKKGWEEIVVSKKHRKELVAGNIADHAIAGEYNHLPFELGTESIPRH